MSSLQPLPQFQIDFDSKEPWDPDTILIIPIESTQLLIHDSAAILGVHAFLKMTSLPYKIKEMYNAHSISPNGKLPVLKCGAYVVSELENIVQLVSSKGISLSNNLTLTEKSDLRAYMSLVHNVIGNSMLYLIWLNDDIYGSLTKYRVGSPFNFPLRILLPWFMRRKQRNYLKALNWAQKTEDEVYNEVKICLVALSERLGENEYFFGVHPTELDALVFGYIFTMITTPIQTQNKFGNMVKEHSNLIRFCQRLEKDYFSNNLN